MEREKGKRKSAVKRAQRENKRKKAQGKKYFSATL